MLSVLQIDAGIGAVTLFVGTWIGAVVGSDGIGVSSSSFTGFCAFAKFVSTWISAVAGSITVGTGIVAVADGVMVLITKNNERKYVSIVLLIIVVCRRLRRRLTTRIRTIPTIPSN